MSGRAPALSFLGVVLGGWIAVRAATFAFWPGEPERIAVAGRHVPAPMHDSTPADLLIAPAAIDAFTIVPSPAPVRRAALLADTDCCAPSQTALPVADFAIVAGMAAPTERQTFSQLPVTPALPAHGATDRWSASAWLLLRRDGATPVLVPNGTLGGSQAGARLTYRLSGDGRPLVRLSGRAYMPLRQTAGAEAAIGLDWQPIRRAPLYLLAERRQAVGDEGRSAFSLTLYGGGSVQLPFDVRLDSYAQAGVVGTRSRDLFVDSAVQLRRPLGPVEIGAGAWGAAQPGAARLDIGPHVSMRLPIERANLRVSADWRFRVAGRAVPGSGPALTLGADF